MQMVITSEFGNVQRAGKGYPYMPAARAWSECSPAFFIKNKYDGQTILANLLCVHVGALQSRQG